MRRKVLVVEDRKHKHNLLKNILSGDYDIIEASDELETMNVLEQWGEGISAIVLDITIQKRSTAELIKRIRRNYVMQRVPIIASGNADMEEEILIAGANDYITEPYKKEVIRNRLLNLIRLCERTAAINDRERDMLTGLYSRNSFFSKVKEIIQSHKPGEYIMACFDIDKFKVINDRYGSKKGDEILEFIGNVFNTEFSRIGGISSRVNADNYAILYPRRYIDSKEIETIRNKVMNPEGLVNPITFCVGRYLIEDIYMEPSAMYDRAMIAKLTVKGRYGENTAIYDESMRRQILEEQEIVGEMETALSAGQFENWYQPQFNHATGALIGAEALIRWRHPVKGMLIPAQFIPIFEKNGFICELDKYVWEQACIFQKEMIDKGYKTAPVSVNISRYDLVDSRIADYIHELVAKFGIPVELLRVEVTETAFNNSGDTVIKFIQKMKEYGFTVEIDDFGSGYSSLNTLKDVPADAIKLDMHFLDGIDIAEKSGKILESVVKMAKWIGISVIAEGVERIEQADFMKSIGCHYIQGFYYSRPLSRAEYERLLMGQDDIQISMRSDEGMSYDEAFSQKQETVLQLQSIIDHVGNGITATMVDNERLEYIYANNQFYELLGYTKKQYREEVGGTFSFIFKDDRESVIRRVKEISKPDKNERIEYRVYRRDRTIRWIRAIVSQTHIFGYDKPIQLSVLRDVTEEKLVARRLEENTKQLEYLNESMKHLVDDTPGGFTKLHVYREGRITTDYINNGVCEMLGISEKDLMAHYRRDSLWGVHPDDRKRLQKVLEDMLRCGDTRKGRCRLLRRDGTYIPLLVFARATPDRSGGVFVNVYYTDASQTAGEEERQRELLENLPCGAGIIAYSNQKLKCTYLNSRFWGLLGREQHEIINPYIIDYIAPEDREYLLRVLNDSILQGEDSLSCDIHIRRINEDYVPFHVNGNFVRRKDGEVIIYATYMPVTQEEMSYREMIPVVLGIMMASSNDLSFVKDKSLSYVCVSHAFAQMVGYSDESEIVGKSDFDIFERELAEKYYNDDKRLIREDKSLIDYIEYIPSKDGIAHFSCTSKYLLKDSAGNIIGIYGVGRDVTENRETYERLKLLTDSFPGGLATYEVSLKGIRRLYTTDGVYALTGYDKESLAATADNPLVNVAEEDYEPLMEQVMKLIKDQKPIDCDIRIIRKDGELRWLNMKAAEMARSGEYVTINAVLCDVNEAVLARKKLTELESESRKRYSRELQLRHELIRDSIVYYQMNLTTGIVEEFHAMYDDMDSFYSGVEISDEVRKVLLKNVLPEDRDIVRRTIFNDALKIAYENGNREVELVYRRNIPDKGYRFVKTEICIMDRPETNDVIAFLYCRDIDEEKKTELSINAILGEDIESILYLDVATGIATVAQMRHEVSLFNVSRHFAFDTEYEKELINYIVQEDREGYRKFFNTKNLKEALKKQELVQFSYRLNNGKGIKRKNIKAFFMDNRQDVIVLSRRDITALYEEEQKKRAELQYAIDEANRANQAKSEFLSHMSHDLRTPLNAVIAFSTAEMTEGASKEKLQEYLNKVNISGNYLLSIINDVLDMSKIEQNKIVLMPEPYHLSNFEKDIRTVVDELSVNKGIEFVVEDTNAGEKGILADRVRLQQVFVNLLSNAVKFTPAGGKVELIIQELRKTGDHKVIKRFIVRDNGIGMSEDFIPHAFESFNQEYRKDMTTESPGTGLGLTIVKELVQLMQGTVTLESRLNVGTTFTIDIPVEITDVFETEAVKNSTDYQKLDGARLLLVEDNRINTEVAIRLLKKKGCIIDCTVNGREGCIRFSESEPGYYQAILMDIRMPVMDGLEATRQIRAMSHPDAKTIPIIAMTANAFHEDEVEAKKSGMNFQINKPIEPKLLYNTLNNLIGMKTEAGTNIINK